MSNETQTWDGVERRQTERPEGFEKDPTQVQKYADAATKDRFEYDPKTGKPKEDPLKADFDKPEVKDAVLGNMVNAGAKAIQVLNRKSDLNPEDRRYVETRVGERLPSLKAAFAKAGLIMPSDDIIMTEFLGMTAEEVERARRYIIETGLLILPNEAFDRYVRLIDTNKHREDQMDTFVSGGSSADFALQDKALIAANCAYGFGELLQEPANMRGRLDNVILNYEASPRGQATRAVGQRGIAVLQAQAKDILDLNGWTIMGQETDGKIKVRQDSYVSGAGGGGWGDGDRVRFDGRYPNGFYNYARVRSAVMKKS